MASSEMTRKKHPEMKAAEKKMKKESKPKSKSSKTATKTYNTPWGPRVNKHKEGKWID
jgi:hypothetical protein